MPPNLMNPPPPFPNPGFMPGNLNLNPLQNNIFNPFSNFSSAYNNYI